MSHANEQKIETTGIEASVEGIPAVRNFGRRKDPNESFSSEVEKCLQTISGEYIEYNNSEQESIGKQTPKPKKQKSMLKAVTN